MNDQEREFDDSTIQRARRFDKLCDEFESQLLGANPPSIEAFLRRVENAHKQSLLVELITIEIHYRRQRGESIAFSDYQGRFPDVWNSLFAETIQKVIAQSMNSHADDDMPNREVSFARLRTFFQTSSRPGWLGRLSHYELESLLGQGAFGIVVKAFDERLHRIVAIKFMMPELAATSPPRKRFLREARTAAAIRHENIVGIYAIEEEPLPYIVMEFIPGITLQQWLDQNGPLELPELLVIAQQLAAGLAAAHAANLIHRDIKPSNILLEEGLGNRAKISDFGLARAVDDASLTSSGLIAGTPMYMAPEQARGEVLDHRADLFSLGSVLYQMASGRPPFRAANTVAMLKRVCEDKPRPIQDVIPESPDWLCAIIEQLMEKKPADRYQTAKEVADLLARCQAELKLNGKVASIGRREIGWNSEMQDIGFEAIKSSVPTVKLTAESIAPFRWIESALLYRTRLVSVGVLAIVVVVSFFFIQYREPGLTELRTAKPESTNSSRQNQESNNSIPTAKVHVWPVDAPPYAIAPFDAEKAKQHQEAWAKYLKVPVEFTNSIGMTFRLIPPADFLMGMSDEDAEAIATLAPVDMKQMFLSSAPTHRVILTRPFYISINEVTQSQFETVTGITPSWFSPHGLGAEKVKDENTDAFPVENITAFVAEHFCNKLSQLEMRSPAYSSTSNRVNRFTDGYRLPSEAEWEWACRAGTTTIWSNGDRADTLKSFGWFGTSSNGHPHVTGQLIGNPFGLFDMHGNVMEWCQDWHSQDYYLRQQDAIVDPIGPETGSARVIRGGNWSSHPSLLGSGCRYHFDPNRAVNGFGIRVALSIPEKGDAISREPAIEFLKSAEVEDSPQNLPIDEVSSADITKGSEAPHREPGWHGWANDAPVPAIAPFDAEKAKQHQEAWAKYLKVPVEFTNSIGMKFRLIPPGEFLMGMSIEEAESIATLNEKDVRWKQMILSAAPVHLVRLTNPYFISIHEVTQAQFEKLMDSNPSYFSKHGKGAEEIDGKNTESYPVEGVNPAMAESYCNKLSLLEKRTTVYGSSSDAINRLADGYRLPTEAEWEWACRSGTTTTWSNGNRVSDLISVAWFGDRNGPHPVGLLHSNQFGLFDMHGNVWEWCQDLYVPDFYSLISKEVAVNPIGPESSDYRVLRGGSWYMKYSLTRSSVRAMDSQSARTNQTGFRIALSIPRPELRELDFKPKPLD